MNALDSVIQTLLRTRYAKVHSDEYIYVRCPLCGDSRKHEDAAHCSIWIRPNMPLVYHCFICEESGIVNSNFLQSLNIQDNLAYNQLGQYNRACMNGIKMTTSFRPRKRIQKMEIPQIRDTKLNQLKLKYMQDRLDIAFTYKSLEYLRIIFSLNDFLELNGLNPSSKYKKMIPFLNERYIGFLSTTKDMITFRAVMDEKYRYIKYNIFDTNPEEEQMYVIPAQVDPLADTIHLNIAEGPFDILGIFFHVKKCKMENEIYASIGGSAYRRVLYHFLSKGFLTNLVVNIYSDKDKDRSFYDKLIESYGPWVKEFHLFYNQMPGQKDFGVPLSCIQCKESVI